MNMDRVRISYLSNGADTNITLSASMDIHLHPYFQVPSLCGLTPINDGLIKEGIC